MNLSLSDDEIRFRDEVRALVSATFPAPERYDGGRAHERRWHAALLEKGWAANKWPEAFGGPGLSLKQIFLW